MNMINDNWDGGNSYEYFMGRWSSQMAPEFLKWLNIPPKITWLDIGCGTGALSESIIYSCEPSQLTCIDPSIEFLNHAKDRLYNHGNFYVGNAYNLPFENDSFDSIVSGLALNFFQDLKSALNEMKRVSKPGGIIAAYVWDYSDRMDFLRFFWDAAHSIDPKSKDLDEGIRFPICNTDNLKKAFLQIGLYEIKVTKLDIVTHFKNFEDYWKPFLGAKGPAPSYLDSLSEKLQEKLKKNIKNKIFFEPDGSIKLIARAIAIKGIL